MQALLALLDGGLNKVYRYSGYAAAFCLAMIAVLVSLSIVSRLLSIYVPGLTEYSGYAMAMGSFLALAYTFEEQSHIRVELFLSRLSSSKRRWAEYWCLGVASVVSVYLAYFLCRLVYFSWKFEEHSEGADAILLWKPQLLVAAGALIFCIAIVHNFLKCVCSAEYKPR